MHRLSPVEQHTRVGNMRYEAPKREAPVLVWEDTATPGLREFEVNVLFTNARATRAALRVAARLAKDLKVSIRVRATIVVPFPLPLDHPQVSIPFTEEVLCGLVSEYEQNSLDITAHLYLS